MNTSELREALAAILEKLDDGEPQSESGTVVTIEDLDETKRDVDLWAIVAGTLVKVCSAEYMKIMGEGWVKYTGDTISSEELADKVRAAQRCGESALLVYVG